MPDNTLAMLMAGGRRRDPYAEKRAYGYKLMQAAGDTSPIQSPWQGAARLAQALAGGFELGMADRDEKVAGEKRSKTMAEAMAERDPAKAEALWIQADPDNGPKMAWASRMKRDQEARTKERDDQAVGFLLPPQGQPQQQFGRAPTGPPEWEPIFQQAAQTTGLPVDLLKRVAVAESAMDPSATSPKGAGGLMQLMPGTARDLGVGNSRDPAQAIPGGAQYLKQMLDKYGNLPHALAGYNWGPGNVDKWLQGGGDPAQLPAETRNYIAKITGGGQQQQGGLQPAQYSPQGGGDAGAQFEAAARRAQQGGRPDVALKYIEMATKAREAGQTRDANRSLLPREEGPDLVFYDSRSGQEVRRVPGGAKKPPGAEGGAFPGSGMDNQARSALARGAADPAYAATPEYALAYGHLSKPRFDAQSGTTIPPEDLSRFRPPTYNAQGQSQAPQQLGDSSLQGAPPAPNPAVVGGPTVVAQPQGGLVATPVQGLPPKEKPMTEAQAKAYGFSQRMATANTLLSELAIQGTSPKGRFLESLPGGVGNFGQSPEYQRFEQAKRNFMNAQLRDESGAVIGPSEFMSADKQYFPQVGQATNRELLDQMAENRRQVVEAMMVKANLLKPGQRYEMPKAPVAQGDQTAPATEFDYIGGKLVPRR